MEYAQARLQARYGARPDEALWQRLAGQGDLGGYLAAARATSLAGWLSGIGERADSHAVELALRKRWREAVGELARWLPAEWRAAVAWSAQLIDLPALAWLAGGEAPLAWMEKDPVLAAEPAGRRPNSRESWLAGWRQRWPDGAEGEALAGLGAVVEAHLAAFAQLPPAAAVEARRALADEARRRFRRGAGHPVAAFAWLLLLALDLERLRGELVLRALAVEAVA